MSDLLTEADWESAWSEFDERGAEGLEWVINEALAARLTVLADQFQRYAASDRNESRSKKDDDPDKHYWDGCADANFGRADDVRALA